MMKRFPGTHPQARRDQRGIVLVFALITLVIMMIGAVALSRSISNSQSSVANIGFKRDLANQGEWAVQQAMTAVRAGGALQNVTTRNASLQSANYSATLLSTNSQGIPLALLSDSLFTAIATTANDFSPAGSGVQIRYLVDRLATAAGTCSPSTCSMANQQVFGGNSSEWISAQNNSGAAGSNLGSAVTPQPIYRVTIRVKGPRNTLSFFQSTFTTN